MSLKCKCITMQTITVLRIPYQHFRRESKMEANISRHELKIKHRRLQEKVKHIKAQYENTRVMLQEFQDNYIKLYEYFPLRRYPKLKRLIKKTASKENMDELKKREQESGDVEQENDERNTEDEGAAEGFENRPLVSGGKPYGVAKQALRKITKLCGLNDEPIEDEDVMTDEELWKHINRRKREIHFYHEEIGKTLHALETLNNKYVNSKTSYFPLRFFTLKRMVREVITETNPDSKYEK